MQEALDSGAVYEILPAIPEGLQDTRNQQDNVPPPSLWTNLGLQCTWMIHRVIGWIKLISWTFTAKYLLIPFFSMLHHWNNWQFPRFLSITLPDCELKHSSREDKRFYVYPDLKIFIKIFSPSARQEFEAQVKTFRHLSRIQGKGIPELYAGGKIEESDELCLVMSYEGEPLKEWNDVARCEVERLVRLLHKNNVHHHDVGLRNVVVDNKQKFTLVDFTLSQIGCKDQHCTEEKDLGMGEEETQQ